MSSSLSGQYAPRTSVQARALQRDATAELLERAFTFALTARLRQYAGIQVDVRSNAWGLLEGKFGGMTVRGYKWRTPLELTAEQLMVDVGEMILDYQKLMWKQTVALKNVPQGSVSFTLSSQDLANFMVHPIMMSAAVRAVKGQAFIFDRNTAAVRVDPATGRGIITYQGTWAGNGQRYAVTMTTPPPAPVGQAAAFAAASARPSSSITAASNTMDQLTVFARRMLPGARSNTGSYASMGSRDEPVGVAAAAAAAAGAAAAAVAAASAPSPRSVRTLTMAAPDVRRPDMAAGPGAAALSLASAGSVDPACEEADESDEVVGEGLRRFFSGLTLNLQGIELRQPVLLVQLPGAGVGAAVAGARAPAAPLRAAAPYPAAPAGASPPSSGPQPALLTITMKVAMLSLPPLDMKF